MEVSDFNTFNRYFPYSIYLVMLDRGERICLHCTLNEVEDESHMLFKCPIYEPERATLLIYIQDTGNCKNFEHLSPNNKLIWLLSSEDTLLSNKLAVFLNKVLKYGRTIHCKFNLT
jgi:hypothetical protein